VNRSAAVLFHQSANARLEQGSTSRPNAARARNVPTEAPASARRAPTTSSIVATTPRPTITPHTAATSPNARCRVRSGSTAASRASSNAVMSATDPRYRSDTIFGLPSTHAISRRYQYGLPLTTFLYRLATTLGHRRSGDPSQSATPEKTSSTAPETATPHPKIKLSGKLPLA